MKKYSNFLTLLAVILSVVAIVLVGYFFYTVYDQYKTTKEAEELMSQFEQNYEQEEDTTTPTDEDEEIVQDEEDNNDSQEPTNTQTSKPTNSGYQIGTFYKGYKIIGIISIPKLNIQYPIFDTDNPTTLKVGTVAIYPAKVEQVLNNPGNVVIAGHNYRNKKMFSKLSTLENGDSIFITNVTGKKLEYKVYNNYTTDAHDFSYATRENESKIEISLTTCTNDSNTRTIIWAKN